MERADTLQRLNYGRSAKSRARSIAVSGWSWSTRHRKVSLMISGRSKRPVLK